MTKVVAVVVTFNRMGMLGECVSALLKQTQPVEKIFIVDNASSDGTAALIASLEKEYPNQIEGVRLLRNVGGAGGFAQGMLVAALSDADFIWVMDDDAEPRPNCLKRLLEGFSLTKSADIVCPLIFGVKNGRPQFYHHKKMSRYLMDRELDDTSSAEIEGIDANAFVGPLIRAEALKELGIPIAQYFIWVDDVEYTFRSGKRGRLFLKRDALIDHKDQQGKPVAWKSYYGFRNYMDFIRLHREQSDCYFLSIGLLLFRAARASVGIALKGDDENRTRGHWALLGALDGLLGNWKRNMR